MNKAKRLSRLYRGSKAHMGHEAWENLLHMHSSPPEPEDFPDLLERHAAALGIPGYLPELARLEWAVHDANSPASSNPVESDPTNRLPESGITVNPTLCILRCSWKHLPALLNSRGRQPAEYPEKGEELVLLWRHPASGELKVFSALDEDLLVLKMAVEKIRPAQVAAESQVPVHAIEAAVDRAVRKGLVFAPVSKIRRDPSAFSAHVEMDESSLSARAFTLQWHITQACDLHCRHCYDRTNREPMELKQALVLLDGFHRFCAARHVKGQISFTGGNPFLHPDFITLYRAAVERGFGLAILGNPTSVERLEAVVAIRSPEFFQVSLEGLPEHNDRIRGPGHFSRSIVFLDSLRKLGVYSIVMLTLTRQNIAQVLPLAKMIENRADLFTFNRLSLMGEGAKLELPTKEEYINFLNRYNDAASNNPFLSLKDNLLNVVRYKRGLELFGGCSGYGCGAAFNFMAVLPDGEAHACRKFHSPIGNVVRSGVAAVYDSAAARLYRAGCAECRSCQIRHVCGGCLATARSFGLDPFKEKDPYCFLH